MEFNKEEPEFLLKEEVQHALKKMKSGKATGPDGISVETITGLENIRIETNSLVNKISQAIFQLTCQNHYSVLSQRNHNQQNEGEMVQQASWVRLWRFC